MLDLPKKIVIFDLECTTWEGSNTRDWSLDWEHREVIQIGGILIDTDTFVEESVFEAFVLPKVNPELSEICMKLTGITQEELNTKGVPFNDMFNDFTKWLGDAEAYCFEGNIESGKLFDFDVLKENSELLDVPFTLGRSRFHNIKKLFADHGYDVKQSGRAPEAFGLEIEARPHNAINDARALVTALKELNNRLQ